jgi:hypothetical protein
MASHHTSRPDELADFLSSVKQRSGRSYEWIAHKAHSSKSTVQRYCAGSSVPHEFGTVERIARVCGATDDEIRRLFRLWENAAARHAADPPDAQAAAATTADRAAGPADAATVVEARSAAARQEPEPAAARRQEPKSPSPAGAGISARLAWSRQLWGWWSRTAALAGAGLAVLVALLVSASGPPDDRGPTPTPPKQWIAGPAWVRPPAPVPRTLFGVTINSSTGATPAFRVGAVRLWDSGTSWASLEPERGGPPDWTVLDRHIDGARRAGLPVLFVFGRTPGWASPGGPKAPYTGDSRASPPDDLRDWDHFVRAVAERYRGRIEAYELWVLGNDRRYFTGSVETLVEMTRRASRIIRAADPKATLVCPGMGNLWTPAGRGVLRRFAELGGYEYCDVAGVKFYQRTASDPPETMLELATATDLLLHEAGVQPRLWSTGTTYSIPLQGSLDETTSRNYAVRFFLVGLYARNLNVERMYFYNWGGTKIPLVLQAEGGAPTRAALAVEQLQRWLEHAQSRACGHGLAIGLPDNVWQCEFTVEGPGGRHDATIRWTHTGAATTTAPPGARALHRLDGTTEAVRAGDAVAATEEPILIESEARSSR